MSVSKTVEDRVKIMYALLATAAARRAMRCVEMHADAAGAEQWAGTTKRWLVKAGAQAARWDFTQPKVSS